MHFIFQTGRLIIIPIFPEKSQLLFKHRTDEIAKVCFRGILWKFSFEERHIYLKAHLHFSVIFIEIYKSEVMGCGRVFEDWEGLL